MTKSRLSQHKFGNIYWITTAVNFMIGMLDAVLLLILGVPFPFLWGLLAFFMGYIPSVGFWIALIPPFILTLLEYGLGKAMIVLVGYVIINGGTQNFVLPKLYGTGLNLSPLVTILSLIVWAAILGPIGALIAIPMTMMVMRLILDSSEGGREVVKLMSSD